MQIIVKHHRTVDKGEVKPLKIYNFDLKIFGFFGNSIGSVFEIILIEMDYKYIKINIKHQIYDKFMLKLLNSRQEFLYICVHDE